ncbi:AAA family ATPase [Candidatus Methanoprimaticola sp. MG2]|uniref:AAA family ATPase n=1 Tax=Candidatus Methanoprimaticola sp. MG2 TaxID=3228838 RepID=UPI0039C709D2
MVDLIRWKDDGDRMPLVLKGVRQCGKTHLLKEFGDRFFDDIIYINLERQKRHRPIFQNENLDLAYYVNENLHGDLNHIFRGASAENFVNNEPMTLGFTANYWKDNRYEVDFIIAKREMTSAVPAEVKSGWKIRATSLKKYIDTFSPERSMVLSMNPPSEGDVVKLPIHLAWTIPRIAERL